MKRKIHLIAYCQGSFQKDRIQKYVLDQDVEIANPDFYEMGRNQTIKLGDPDLFKSLRSSDEVWVVQGQTSGGPGVYFGVYPNQDHYEADSRLCSAYKQYLVAKRAKRSTKFFKFSHYGQSQGTARERSIIEIFPKEFSLFMKWWPKSFGGFKRR